MSGPRRFRAHAAIRTLYRILPDRLTYFPLASHARKHHQCIEKMQVRQRKSFAYRLPGSERRELDAQLEFRARGSAGPFRSSAIHRPCEPRSTVRPPRPSGPRSTRADDTPSVISIAYVK